MQSFKNGIGKLLIIVGFIIACFSITFGWGAYLELFGDALGIIMCLSGFIFGLVICGIGVIADHLSVLVRNSQEQPTKAVGTAGASVTYLSGIADNVVEERKTVTYSAASGDAWICKNCNTRNMNYTSTCKCGQQKIYN